jgi:hypothetical protein
MLSARIQVPITDDTCHSVRWNEFIVSERWDYRRFPGGCPRPANRKSAKQRASEVLQVVRILQAIFHGMPLYETRDDRPIASKGSGCSETLDKLNAQENMGFERFSYLSLTKRKYCGRRIREVVARAKYFRIEIRAIFWMDWRTFIRNGLKSFHAEAFRRVDNRWSDDCVWIQMDDSRFRWSSLFTILEFWYLHPNFISIFEPFPNLLDKIWHTRCQHFDVNCISLFSFDDGFIKCKTSQVHECAIVWRQTNWNKPVLKFDGKGSAEKEVLAKSGRNEWISQIFQGRWSRSLTQTSENLTCLAEKNRPRISKSTLDKPNSTEFT